jgi:biofilm PGA synthesis N-glycosyltransferase PgaC
VLLVDDGSVDSSPELAREFVAMHENARVLTRTRTGAEAAARAATQDRLASAPEVQGFCWGVEHLSPGWDVVTKMDGDLKLPPTLLHDVRRAFDSDPQLGVVGSYLSIVAGDGTITREHNPPHHVRGPNKFYRRGCFVDISPLPALPGWETVDELRARRLGWSAHPIEVESGDIIHLRPTGSHDGKLRAYRRWGLCAWGYGAHPLMVLAGGIRRGRSQPYVLGGASYIIGWVAAGLRRAPRADTETREFCRKEDLTRLRSQLRAPPGLRRAMTGRP